ncbi:hypothetical protein [uncultured Salinicola sp.]|uniref:hypothetical protein n=1 Tax=uncultured Salinicola sp. TaxID=1193542 RepID=UPI002608B9BA|nr:hypothetical protein [uncultured Salinicola sp.]
MARNEDREGRASPVPLTPMQYRFMLALQARLEANPDIGPTYADLMHDLGLRSKSGVARLVSECVERGRIRKLSNRDRSLVVLHPVSGSEEPGQDLIRSFSDRELIMEVQRRGLMIFKGVLTENQAIR